MKLDTLTPAGLGARVIPGWQSARHIDFLNRELVKAAMTPGDRLIISIPPQHGKSTMVSRLLPTWYLGIRPDHRVLLASYGADFAAQWGRSVRDIIEDNPDLGIRVRPDSSAANRWDIEGHEGGMQTAGVGGPITGKGADLFIIDDPVKDDSEAFSQTYRDANWEWWTSTAVTRQRPGATFILIMTRWHEDDLAGRLIKHGQETGDEWRVITLPAIAMKDDVLCREPGEALWPERYPLETLGKLERGMGTYWWASLYQQNPQPAGGGLFKRDDFRRYRMETAEAKLTRGEAPHDIEYYCLERPGEPEKRYAVKDCWRFATVDLAASTKTSADYTVVAAWAVTKDNDLLLLDLYRGRLEGPDQIPQLQRMHEQHQFGFLGVESTSYQLTLIQGALRAGLPIRPLKADKDKWSRALTAEARYAAHQVFHPKNASWLGDFEEEMLSFPKGAHDDQVDTVSYAAGELAKGGFAKVEHRPSIWV